MILGLRAWARDEISETSAVNNKMMAITKLDFLHILEA
jgi:hypothetical protein